MSDILIKKAYNLNSFDSVSYKNNPNIFRLDNKNETEQDLILIYMYILPKFATHGIKVGMTKCKMDEIFWHAIKSRIHNQVHELALTDEQYVKYGDEREVIYWGVCLDAHNENFKDYSVHGEIKSRCAGLVERELEWFTNVPKEELIDAFEACRKDDSSNEIYTPRKEQKDCINALKNYFKDHSVGGRFLLNCKMRYGKSYTTYKYCEEVGLSKILILTFIPAVESSWQEDLTHIQKHYDYFTDANIKKPAFNPKIINKPFVLFLSLQNYLGKDILSETKEKIKKLQDVEWDLVILDEYHFGAWNEKTQGTLESQEDLDEKYQKELAKTKDVLERFKIKTKQTICLSGTPFKAIAKGEFAKENTFTYSYFDEQRNKYPNSERNDFKVVNPDYEHFPDMKIFGYNMSMLFSNMTSSVFSGDQLYGKKYFSLNKFFETRKDLNPTEPCVFLYEEEIKKWLQIIKGRSTYGDKFPYSNLDIFKDNNKHTLWLLPRVNAVHAMAKLLEEDEYFRKYQIINLSEEEAGAGVDAYDYLNENITVANNTNKLGSIALTVNKLTIGVTVKEWFSIFVLKDLASPEQYFQSIFRIQTPFKEKGKIVKRNGYVYDFNIDRAAALLLKYAEQSQEVSVTKLEIAKLIVKYLPIFINGEMDSPISEDVFYQLAEYGDISGIPLSRKITDISMTTRMLDDDVIAAMLNDNEVSDVFKRVFAHAKFNKTKSQTMTIKPDIDGFDTKIAKDGRDKGYELGIKDSDKYIDYDDNKIQVEFESGMEDYIKDLCPSDYDLTQKTWWTNGFIKGYEGGVNAPVKKTKCGQEDGIKFIEEIKKTFGDKIIWKEDTKKTILDFVHKHLNGKDVIPEQYRGSLYKRWYCDSFKNAVKNGLKPNIQYEKGKSVEDAENIMKHILGRLFEFLYISVYRETSFQEIFKNADPSIFLEAVGITKIDFEVINKYHVFQENVLNNYIHQFFVNESMGSKINLEDENIKKQYRNSFDWFGFGLEYGSNPESVVPTGGQHFVDFARYQLNKMSDKQDSEQKNLNEVEKQIDEEETPIIDVLPSTYSLKDRIVDLLEKSNITLKSAMMSELLGVSKKEINRTLYGNRDIFSMDLFFNWKLK